MRKLSESGMAWLLLSLMILVIDRYSKMWMLDHLMLGEPLTLLPVLNLTLAYNTGAAFSFLHNASGWQQYLLGGLATGISIFILLYLFNASSKERWQNAALSLILAGAIGNAWDRVLYGHVIDFISFHVGEWHFAIFNIADSAICVGAFLLILLWIKPSCTR
jgi:signal peptidase II